jgi:hypothetical protein
MHSTERLWTPEAGAGKHLKLGPNTILTTYATWALDPDGHDIEVVDKS